MTCTSCHKGFIIPGKPKGSMVDRDYFSPAPSDATERTKAVVLLTDIFGLPSPNPKIIADHLAEHVRVDVWVPDLFNGKPPADADELLPLEPDRAGVRTSWLTSGLLILKIIASLPGIFANRSSVVDPRVRKFIENIKAEKNYERIGAIGYCFGGAIAGRIGSTDSVNTLVIAHPGPLTDGQIRAIKVPTSWALSEDDAYFKEKSVVAARAIFKKKEENPDHVDYEFNVWKGTAHGFALRPNLTVPDVKAAYEGTLDQAVAWFKKTL